MKNFAILLLSVVLCFATPIYFLIMDGWKSALLLFVAYMVVPGLIMFLSVILRMAKQINAMFFILSAIYIVVSIVLSVIFVVFVCSLLWEYDGIFVGILFVSNICYGIFIALMSPALVIVFQNGIKQKQAELAEAKKKEQQEIIETAVKNALKEYKNAEK